jgi:glycerol-3-phosphate dehydrogenase (NAD(P)+)
MKDHKYQIALIGAGTIGTALGNIMAEAGHEKILLHSVEPEVVRNINTLHINSKYFPSLQLHRGLSATTNETMLEHCRMIFLAIPSVGMIGYLRKIRQNIPEDALLINLAKGFGCGNQTIIECLKEEFPNPLCTLKGPSFAREIINRLPTGFTLGYESPDQIREVPGIFANTNIHLDYSDDIRGVEILSILKNIYAVALGIVDAQFNSPNLRFLVLTKAFREMRSVLETYGGKVDTLFKFCGYGDFTLTALNDLSRNRTLGLLIGKGFFTEHVSHELVLEGKTAVNVFYEQISKKMSVEENFPIIAELYHIFQSQYEVSLFVNRILDFNNSHSDIRNS